LREYSLPFLSKVKNELAQMPEGDPLDIYSRGFIGAYFDPDEHEQLKALVQSEGQPWAADTIAHGVGFAGQGAGKVILLHKEIQRVGWLAKLGYPNQAVGDCVSHGTAKSIGYTLCCSITHGQGSLPVTNGIEKKMWPIASEPHYWFRGKSSDGWYAAAALRAVKEKTGVVIRKAIPGACDLTEYSRETAHRYGSSPPPKEVTGYLSDHPVMNYSECETFEEVIDMLSAGYGIQTDGGEGFAKETDENGVARRSGSWSHSMSIHGFIDTPEFKAKYGCGGLVFQNSWGAWNKNSHAKIMGTNEGLPAGAFIALWKDVPKRSYFAISSVKGWPNRKLPDWNMRELV